VIGTHDGQFHCDEVLACAMLGLLAEYRDAEIRRSRDAAVLDQCDVVVDVGAVFDPAAHRYDHHQRYWGPESSFGMSLSSSSASTVIQSSQKFHYRFLNISLLCRKLVNQALTSINFSYFDQEITQSDKSNQKNA